MDPVVGSAASSSSRPTRDQPTVPTESLDAPAESVSDVIGPMSVFRDESNPNPNLTAQNNLRSLMADLSSVPLEGQPPPEPVSATAEPDAEPANLKYNEAWSNFEGKLIIISGHPNSGKRTVTAELIQLFSFTRLRPQADMFGFSQTLKM